jgi:hypothetical protein
MARNDAAAWAVPTDRAVAAAVEVFDAAESVLSLGRRLPCRSLAQTPWSEAH